MSGTLLPNNWTLRRISFGQICRRLSIDGMAFEGGAFPGSPFAGAAMTTLASGLLSGVFLAVSILIRPATRGAQSTAAGTIAILIPCR